MACNIYQSIRHNGYEFDLTPNRRHSLYIKNKYIVRVSNCEKHITILSSSHNSGEVDNILFEFITEKLSIDEILNAVIRYERNETIKQLGL